MKALSIRQPWAFAITHGRKDIENRSWPTGFRGPVLIHASAGMTRDEVADFRRFIDDNELGGEWLDGRTVGDLERGGIVAAAEITDCAWHPEIWSDVARMRTLNGEQAAKGREMHLCPLQFDIVDRLIESDSNPGDLVYDPFGGLMTVPLRAVLKGRRGMGVELNPGYFEDGVRILREADRNRATPSLFDLIEAGPDDEEDDGVNDLAAEAA